MNIINIFYYLAVILIFAKSFGLLARKLGLPQVAGYRHITYKRCLVIRLIGGEVMSIC